MVQIKAAQDRVLSDYAENCIADVVSCMAANNYDSATTEQSKNIAINACKSQIVTCMSVNGNVLIAPTPLEISSWANGVYTGTVGNE